jgi:hypothetical protein
MRPDSFEFTVTIPSDSRLLGAVRLLTTQAAGYAQLSPDAGRDLADEVERAADAAMTATQVAESPIELQFAGDAKAITVRISCDAAQSAATPHSSPSDNGISVHWTTSGARRVCHIRQPVPA